MDKLAASPGSKAREQAPAGPVLEVQDLRTWFYTRAGLVKAVDGVSFSLGRGEMLAIVGESGCGKSVTALSLMRLVADPPGRIVDGSVRLGGADLLDQQLEVRRGAAAAEMVLERPDRPAAAMVSDRPVAKAGDEPLLDGREGGEGNGLGKPGKGHEHLCLIIIEINSH